MTIFTSHTITTFIEFPLFLFARRTKRSGHKLRTPHMASSHLHLFFYLCTSFSPPQSLSFQPFCVTTQNTKGEVHLKQNRSYPSFLVFRPGENVGEANRAPSFQSWQISSQSRYPNIYSAVEFVMNVTSGIRVRYFWAAGRFFKNLSEKLPCLSTSPNSGQGLL